MAAKKKPQSEQNSRRNIWTEYGAPAITAVVTTLLLNLLRDLLLR